ncbi:protein with signal peptide plus 12 transmembrane domain [Cryptosporidium bovis]|uniref:protein with signal peptide plus 12 transmembrane domain n=1 Tax=Cryptosporidium bovis TaxID=310047 RepID=UPI003519FCCF|nr:protein with signal peptide plus 12 transmembrane domain [Cryptosporidium bovis]
MFDQIARVKVILGGFALNIILGMLHSMSNASMYVASYMMFSKNSFLKKNLVTLSDVSWVYTLNVALIGLTLPFGGYINRRLGIRTSLYITTMIVVISTFSAYYIVSSYYLFTIVFGCIVGIANGISFNIPQYCAYKCWPNNKGTASSIVASGLALSPIIFSPLQTTIANPNNLSPRFKIGNSLYFDQEEVLLKVPNIFIAMGILVLALSTITLLTLLEPKEEIHQLADTDENNIRNEEGRIKFESDDYLIKELCKSERNIESVFFNQKDNDVNYGQKINRNSISSCNNEICNIIEENHNRNNTIQPYMSSLLYSKNVIFGNNANNIRKNKLSYMKFYIDIIETNSENGYYFPPTFSPHKYNDDENWGDEISKQQTNNHRLLNSNGNVKVNVNSLNICADNNFSCLSSDSWNDKQENGDFSLITSKTREVSGGIKEYIYNLIKNYSEYDGQNKNNSCEIFITIKLLQEKQFWLIFWLLFFFTQYVHFITSWWKNIGIININIPDDTLAIFGTIVTSLCNILGRFFFGSLLDKFNGRFCFISISSSCLITMILFQFVINFGSRTIYLFGICTMFFNFGAGFVLFPPIVANHFGVKHYTFIYGIVYIGRSFSVLVSSLLTSFILRNFSIEFCSVVVLIFTGLLFLLSFRFKDEFEFSDPILEKGLF